MRTAIFLGFILTGVIKENSKEFAAIMLLLFFIMDIVEFFNNLRKEK